MKKVLAVILSVMMLFSALSVGATALDTTDSYLSQVLEKQVILSFNLNGGSIKGGVRVYEGLKEDPATGEMVPTFTYDSHYTDSVYYMIPETTTSGQGPNDTVTLPSVNPPSGYAFNGWYCYTTNETYAANRPFEIPNYAAGTVIEFTADYSRSEPEEDTMAGVMEILVKVFGTIIGLLFLQGEADPVDAGMKMMEQLLSNLFE